jgi:hypothetical protein
VRLRALALRFLGLVVEAATDRTPQLALGG